MECKGIEIKKEVLLLLDLQLKEKWIWRIGLQVRTPPFHGGKSGALPLCATRIASEALK